MAQILRQSTPITVRLGPFVSQSDGYTPVTASAAVNAADQAEIFKADSSTTTAMGATVSAVTGAAGWYAYRFTSADTDTIGTLEVVMQDADTYLPVWKEFQVIDSTVYDTIYTSGPTLLTSKDVGQLYESTVSSVTSQLSFVMTDGITNDDIWVGNTVTIQDVTTGETVTRWVADVSATNNSIAIASACPFTVAAGDTLRVESSWHPMYTMLYTNVAVNTSATALITGNMTFDASTSSNLNVNVAMVNSIEIIGSGSAESLFRTAAT